MHRSVSMWLCGIVLWAAGASFSYSQKLPSYTVAISAPHRSYHCVPVSVAVPKPKPPAAWGVVAVTDLQSDKPVPCTAMDLFDEEDRAEVTWIVRDLEQGASRRYRVAFTDDTRPYGDSWVWVGEPENGAVEIEIDEGLFTRYCYEGAPKPYCHPLIGPTGVPVTRAYPMEDLPEESHDHRHHRSFWFTFGEVNGHDFWAENDRSGLQVHKRFDALDPGRVYGVLRASNDWVTKDGDKICEDVRELRVYNIPEVRLLDFTVTVRATEGPVEFGDTKEGMMGFRVASAMRVTDSKGQVVNPEARITNSEGHENAAAWGKSAAWCDYSAPIDGKWVGISIFDHPSGFRHPTYWHVRTYGLFAANPFGLRYFVKDETGKGRHTMQPGEELTFRYRVLIHPGDAEEAKVADWYAEFADPPTVEVQ